MRRFGRLVVAILGLVVPPGRVENPPFVLSQATCTAGSLSTVDATRTEPTMSFM
jgi:hypothetical protein